MRICIDVSQVIYGTGVGAYTKNLVSEMLKFDSTDEFILFGGSIRRRFEFPKLFPPTTNSVLKTSILSPTLADIFWNRLHTLNIEKFVGGVDVYHSSDWAQAPSKAYKVTTIHDLAPLRYPDETPRKIREAHERRLKWVVKEVDKIIAVSSFTKQEAIDLLGLDPERVIVIPEAGDKRIKKADTSSILSVLQKFRIHGRYILAVGTNPRKNLNRIVQAFNKISTEFSPISLVITGTKPREFQNRPNMIFTGFINFEQMSALYCGTEALVYPSLYEGFGQPILEAMKLGVPVVTSNTSSMPEVAGDAAILVDPNEVQSIKDGIEKVLSNRQEWIKKGIARAKEFSWEDTAKLTLRVYKEAVG